MEPGMMNSGAGAGEALGITFMLAMIAIYLFFSYTFVVMAKKLDHDDIAWWGWVPIMNTLLIIKMAEKPGTWFLFLLLPIVNIVIFAMLWMEVARKLGKSPGLGIMMALPILNFIAAGILAFGNDDGLRRVKAQSGPAPRSPQKIRQQ